MPMAAKAITAVANQPKALSTQAKTKSPITSRRAAISTIMIIIGTATTPLTPALQTGAFAGSICMKFNTAPTTVATAIVPSEAFALRGCRAKPIGRPRASPIAYATDPARIGTVSNPAPMIPIAKIVKAKPPVKGRKASPASAEVWILVMPWACKVAAAIQTMNKATRLDEPMPT
jgi:hypothetical protein